MRVLPHEITVTAHRRQVAITEGDGTERLGFFHRWDKCHGEIFALVENTGGTMEYIPLEVLRFLPVDDELLPEEMEKAYHQMGILKGGVSNA